MVDVASLVALLELAGVTADDMSAQFVADASKAMTELGVTDSALRSSTLAELETLARTVLMNTYREEAALAAEATDPVAYVYLGPDDNVTRPFCEALVNTWLTPDEIDQLDNGADMDAMTSGGGYNCRHQFIPLYGDQPSEYEHGDVDEANGEAP